MDLVNRFREYIELQRLFDPREKILLAVSGGMDSVVLCHLFSRCGYSFGIAHCNFRLRQAESDRDEEFVKSLAGKYGAPFFVKQFDTAVYAKEHKVSVQVAARELRYGWFEEIRKDYGYAFVATAHHLNDNIETLLINFFRGTGVGGLHGILPVQGKIVRPLLFAKREEIRDYQQQHTLPFVEDSSNLSDKYTRNFFRLKILPLVKEAFPETERILADNTGRFREVETLYRQAIAMHLKGLRVKKGEETFIPLLKLKKSEPLPTIVYELFKPFSFGYEQSRQIIDLLESEPGKIALSSTHRVVKDRKWLIVSPLKSGEPAHIIIEEGRSKVSAGSLDLDIRIIPIEKFAMDPSPETACLDLKKISFPLTLRRWRKGDYFYPLGMKKKKKLSRFFIDQKLSIAAKEKVWVLTTGSRIAWVAGMRIDDRVKITGRTGEVLKLTLSERRHGNV